MLTRTITATLHGIDGYPVIVETDINNGLPCFHIVGLADITIRESGTRVKPAIVNSGYDFPNRRVTVNLSPADKPKEGSHFDLPIAIGVILSELEKEVPSNIAIMGELSLDGRVNSIRGALALAIGIRKSGIRNVLVPYGNAREISILEDINIIPVTKLSQAVDLICNKKKIRPYMAKRESRKMVWENDFSQVLGQESAKRAITIGAAGNHGILLMGGPGCGKTMMAKRIPTILPELTYEEKLELTGIYSVAGLLNEKNPIVEERPFRSPHHSISEAGLMGGGMRPQPGELSLAHRGVLFLDELGEFKSRTIDAIRQPIEDGEIIIKRNMQEMVFPSDVMIVAAANPCKCGYLWDENKICTCTKAQLDSHRRKLMGPFSDRIDIHIKVMKITPENLRDYKTKGKVCNSAELRKQVIKAREIQKRRYEGTKYKTNGGLDDGGINKYCILDDSGRKLLEEAYYKLDLTMRANSKIIKISRTLADMDGNEKIERRHIAEAIMYRTSNWDNLSR